MNMKQKINSRLITESELVGLYDLMPHIIWKNNFLDDQGCSSKDTIVYYYNQSAILLEKNWRASSGKNIYGNYPFSVNTK